jgi:hypothetical protein
MSYVTRSHEGIGTQCDVVIVEILPPGWKVKKAELSDLMDRATCEAYVEAGA